MKKILLFSIVILSLWGCEKDDNTLEIIPDFAISVEYNDDYSRADITIIDASLNVPTEGGAYYEWESSFFSTMGQYGSGWEHEATIYKNGYYEVILTIDHKYQKIKGINITLLK